MKDLKTKLKRWLRSALEFCFNPRMLLCFGMGWMITNGWAYIAAGLGLWLDIDWLFGIGIGYLTALWIPFTPEKIITVIIAIFLLKKLFPNDKKTLEKLYKLKAKIIETTRELREKRREKKQAKKSVNKKLQDK